MKALVVLGVFFLSSCQTIRVNGVEIDRETQAFGIFSAAVIAGMIYSLEREQDADGPDKGNCKTYAAIPDSKGGEPFCAIPLD